MFFINLHVILTKIIILHGMLSGALPRILIMFFSAVLEKEMVLMVPPGYIMFEEVTKGPLIYGVRKSFFVKSETSHKNYTAMKEILGKNQDVDVMEKVLPFLK